MSQPPELQSQLGTAVTMIVGLLFLFLIISQAGKYHNSGFLLAKIQEEENQDQDLASQREMTLVQIGVPLEQLTRQKLEDDLRPEDFSLAVGENGAALQYNHFFTKNAPTDEPPAETAASTSKETAQVATEAATPTPPANNQTGRPVHTVQDGETLYSIASRIYGSGRYWRQISRANPNLTNPGALRPGMRLTIPSPKTPNKSYLKWLQNNED